MASELRRRHLSSAPLSFEQQRLWFVHQLSASAAYNTVVHSRLSGRLEVSALEDAIADVTARHDILRTTYSIADDSPVQRVQPVRGSELSMVDLSHLGGDARDERLASVVRTEQQRVFDLTAAPPAHFCLVRLGPLQHVLIHSWHHIARDAWSESILASELGRAYRARLKRDDSALQALPLQYSDYAAWQRDNESALECGLPFWIAHLEDLPDAVALATSRTRQLTGPCRAAALTATLDGEAAQALRQLARRRRVTTFVLLLAALQVLLSRYSGQSDIVVGCPMATRSDIRLEGLIGCCLNLLPLRSRLRDGMTFSELLEQVKRTVLAAYEYRETPFDWIVRQVAGERDSQQLPLVQVLFATQNAPTEALTLPGVTCDTRLAVPAHTKAALEIHAAERTAAFELMWIYNADLFELWNIQQMVNHYRSILISVADRPDQPIDAIPLMDAEERRRLLVSWNEPST